MDNTKRKFSWRLKFQTEIFHHNSSGLFAMIIKYVQRLNAKIILEGYFECRPKLKENLK